MTDPSVSVTIGGNDVSSDVISLSTEQDICRLAQTCDIELKGSSGSHLYNPWESLVVAINSTNRLTGYVEDATKSRPRGHYTVRGMDEMKRAIDYFVTDEVRVEEDRDAGYWIDYWLVEAGITTSGSISTGRDIPQTLPDEVGWQYVSIADIILECLGYAGGGYAVIVDGDGVAQIQEKTITGSGTHTLTPIEFSRSQDNSWHRDRAVVFGITSGSWDDGEWVPGEVTLVAEAPGSPPTYPNTVVLSSSYVQTQAEAEDLADDILSFFDEYLDIKRCLIEGDESIWLGDSASVSDSWSGYSGTGLITSIETTVDGSGFRQLVSLDEKCGFIWGSGKPYGQIAFIVEGTLSTGDIGIWFYCDIEDGLTLRNTYSGVKTAPDGAAIEIYVQTSTDGTSWTTQHTNTISDGSKLSGKEETFSDDFVEEDTLVRFYVNQVGSSTAGADLTFSVGVKTGEM